MAEPLIAQKGPYEVNVKEGRNYWWCACGRSKHQPFCDGSHQGTGLEPVQFTAAKTETVWLCGCKRTGSRPHCDGTHGSL
jgi:CDGSH-type Zn-finger protein